MLSTILLNYLSGIAIFAIVYLIYYGFIKIQNLYNRQTQQKMPETLKTERKIQNKFISDLGLKMWFRFIKVIYVITFILSTLLIFVSMMDGMTGKIQNEYWFIPTLKLIIAFTISLSFNIIIFEIVKRIFYYIIIGRFIPETDIPGQKKILIKKLFALLVLIITAFLIIFILTGIFPKKVLYIGDTGLTKEDLKALQKMQLE